MPCNQASSLLSYAPKGDPRDFSENAVDHNFVQVRRLENYWKCKAKSISAIVTTAQWKSKTAKSPGLARGLPYLRGSFLFPSPPTTPYLSTTCSIFIYWILHYLTISIIFVLLKMICMYITQQSKEILPQWQQNCHLLRQNLMLEQSSIPENLKLNHPYSMKKS